MTASHRRRRNTFAGKARGFTLIEVMIAVLVLGFGLLGFALLQTMSVRFVQSANHRTQATNLAYEMLDQMRVNRIAAAQYIGNYTATADGCERNNEVSPARFKLQWQCRMQSALGAGSTATVTYLNGEAVVAITWGDQRWEQDDADKDTTFDVRTRL